MPICAGIAGILQISILLLDSDYETSKMSFKISHGLITWRNRLHFGMFLEQSSVIYSLAITCVQEIVIHSALIHALLVFRPPHSYQICVLLKNMGWKSSNQVGQSRTIQDGEFQVKYHEAGILFLRGWAGAIPWQREEYGYIIPCKVPFFMQSDMFLSYYLIAPLHREVLLQGENKDPSPLVAHEEQKCENLYCRVL